MNIRLERKNKLEKRLAEIDSERTKSLRVPAITEMMMDEVFSDVHSMLDARYHGPAGIEDGVEPLY